MMSKMAREPSKGESLPNLTDMAKQEEIRKFHEKLPAFFKEATEYAYNQEEVESILTGSHEPDMSHAMLEQGRLNGIWTKFSRCFRSHEDPESDTSSADCPECLSHLKEMAEAYQTVYEEIDYAFRDFSLTVLPPMDPERAHSLMPASAKDLLKRDEVRFRMVTDRLKSIGKMRNDYGKLRDDAVSQYEEWKKAKVDRQRKGTGDLPNKDQNGARTPKVPKKNYNRKGRAGRSGKR